ncbi:MAG: ribonuclease E/G [Bacteroidetes bacterium]|nr:MAG: ribonuclease E/G [Bacteroidota bacterium]
MSKDLIIDVSSHEVTIALLEDKILMELHKEKHDNNYSVGDLYLGRVKKVIPGLNAAFVNVGHEKDAFLHYLDLGPQVNSLNKFIKINSDQKTKNISLNKFKFEKEIEKSGKISDVLSSNQTVLVQIAKEPISSKGPRITSEIAFAGRYIVLVPFSNRISISQKIKDRDERNRLKRLIQSIRPENFGIIVRTVAENRKVSELLIDMESLTAKWDTAIKKLAQSKPPTKIFGELNRSSTILRDLLNESFGSIVVNDKDLLENLKTFIQTIAPDKADLLKLHKGKTPIFEHFDVDRQIKGSFGKKVNMKSGSYLIIEHTEAMHVVDVNSGQRLKKDSNQESSAFDVNLIAAKEVARQLRLRDMGGIIVIDFIDMNNREHRQKLHEFMTAEMKNDLAKHSILPISKFGLMQITRQRVRPEMEIEILEKCPVCDGTGEVKASVLIIDEIENNIRFMLQEQNEAGLRLHVHPFLYSFFKKGIFNYRWKWFKSYKKCVKLKPVNSYHFLEYHFFNKSGDEIKI